MKTITLAIPCKAALQARFSLCLLQALNQIQARTGYKPLVRILVGKSNIVHARSILLTEWYETSTNEDLLLFIDSDQTFLIEDIEGIVKKEGDVVSGIYVNGAGFPTCYPLHLDQFQKGEDDRLLYSGCGFMLIRRALLGKVIQFLEEETGASRYAVSREEQESFIIPFFQTKLLKRSELSPDAQSGDWLGEDYSFCWRVRAVGGTVRAFFSRTLGHEIPQVSLLPEGYFPNQSSGPVPSIVYYCGSSLVKFCPKTKGLGGSEQAVVQLSKAWASQGLSVTVYGNVYPGVYDGVVYKGVQEFDFQKEYETLILWRSYGASLLPLVKAKRILLDLHDVPRKEVYPLKTIEEKKAILCVKSQFHRSLLPHIPDSYFFLQPNGIATSLIETYKPIVSHREPLRFVWTSSYDRGLPEFLRGAWRKIRARYPSAVLHVYYGKDLCPPQFQEKMLTLFEEYKGHVIDHGKVEQLDTFKARWASSYHVYLTDFAEIDCLSIRESVVAGSIPIVLKHAAFSERPAVYVEPNLSISQEDQLIGILERLESDPSGQERLRATLRAQLHEMKLDYEWSAVAAEWRRVLMKQ